MLNARRWLVRPKQPRDPKKKKQSRSPLESKPMDYEPPLGDTDPNSSYWKWRWQTPSVHASFECAKSFWDRHEDIAGLTFVVHHFGRHEPRLRLVCLDFDKCIKDGEVDPKVAELIGLLGSFTEFSQSKRGLHTFVLVEDCPAFTNCLQVPIGGIKMDVLCANAVNVTGDIYDGHEELVTISYAELESIEGFTYKEPSGGVFEHPEWWSDDPIDDVPPHLEYLVPFMEMKTAVEGEGGSLDLFAAACRLMRHNVVGREAEALLRCVPAEPSFGADQIQRTVECAYRDTVERGQLGDSTPEFEKLAEVPELTEDQQEAEDREEKFGYNFLTASELLAKELKLEYLVEGAFVGEGTLFIGGDQKTFKTNIAMDLLVSIATGTPFLNTFNINETRSTAIFTAEIGEVKAQILLRAILAERGLHTMDGLDIVNEVPKFGLDKRAGEVTGDAIRRLRLFLRTRKPQVVVFDPLYLAFLTGEAGDLYGMGAILSKIQDICNDFGVWAIFCHHAKKLNSETEFRPMKLTDFYGSGPSQYARQWCLSAHAEPFHKGVANLYLTIGGSTQSREDVYEVRIDEGVSDQLVDRGWEVDVKTCEDTGSKPISSTSLKEAMEGLGEVTPGQLATMLGRHKNEAQAIEQALFHLVKAGEVTMRTGKFSLSMGGFPE